MQRRIGKTQLLHHKANVRAGGCSFDLFTLAALNVLQHLDRHRSCRDRATGAIARTATNIKSGAVSPWSGVFQSVFVLLTLLLFAPYASHIPLASMAPILMVVAYNMSEIKSFAHIVKLRSGDSLVLITTFLLTVFVNLTVAVPVGLLLAIISFVKRASTALEVNNYTMNKLEANPTESELKANECPEIASFTIQGPLFFGAADRFESALIHSINERPSV